MSRLASKHVSGADLADLSRGTLGLAPASRARAHVDGCPRCQASLLRVERGLAAMAQVSEQDAPELAWDHIGARVYWSTSSERRAKERRSQPRAGQWRVALVGAAGAALVAGGVVWGLGPGPQASPKPDTAALVQPSSPQPTHSQFSGRAEPEAVEGSIVFARGPVLSRGHVVSINEPVVAGSRFSTDEGELVLQFGANSAFRIAPHSNLAIERLDAERIALRIEGRVDVDITRRRPGQQFAIIAGEHEVQVRGTAFRVDYVRASWLCSAFGARSWSLTAAMASMSRQASAFKS